jgi:hypothetical protein
MSIKRNVLWGVVFAGSVTMSLSAFAGGYVGASIGEAEYTIPALDTGSLDLDSFSLEAGYSLSENFALEASYQDMGSISDGETELSMDGFALALVGTLPLNESFALTASLGSLFWDLSVSDSFDEISADGSDMFYSVGAKYTATEAVDLTLDFGFYDADSVINMDTLSFGVHFNF